jgi:hypothetical protein
MVRHLYKSAGIIPLEGPMRGMSMWYMQRYMHVTTAIVTMSFIAFIAFMAVMTFTTSTAFAQGQDKYHPPNPSYDGRYAFARMRYTENLNDPCTCPVGGEMKHVFGWEHDYPRADKNITQLLSSELQLRVNMRTDSTVVIKLDDPKLMRYPMLYMSEPDCWHPTATEVEALHKYLLKGGFLIQDDCAMCQGSPEQFEESRQNFEDQMRRVLPGYELVPITLTDPHLNRFFKLHPAAIAKELTESGAAQGEMLTYAIYERNDPKRRIMVLANYNVTLHAAFRYESQGSQMAYGHDAFKVGINYLLYGLTQ